MRSRRMDMHMEKDSIRIDPMSTHISLAIAPRIAEARFGIGEVVRHRTHPVRGVIFDVDAEYANTEEWWQAIPEENRPARDQPFYHLLAENDDAAYIAYVSQQNLERDDEAEPPLHPALGQIFGEFSDGRFHLRPTVRN